MDRRMLLGGLAAVVGARPGLCATDAQGAVQPAAVLVAGPAGGRLDRWGELIATGLGRGMAGKAALVRQNSGGIDGVTGANQFDARVEPDGATALLAPGAAMLPWLTGEMRTHFEPGRWIPLWIALSSVTLQSRVPLVRGETMTIAAGGPAGVELPFLLALDLMGVKATLVPVEAADAAVMVGSGTRAGARPVLTLGCVVASGEIVRDPGYPGVPTAMDIAVGRGPDELLAGLQAASLAAAMEAGLFLPGLTAASSVALWRRSSVALLQDPAVQMEAAQAGAKALPADLASACMAKVAAGSGTLLTLRRWLGSRYDWRPT